MATDNSGDLSAFVQFANAQLQAGTKLTLCEALNEWWETHPPELSPEESEEIETMIQEAIDDLEAGEIGRPFEEFNREFKQRHGLE